MPHTLPAMVLGAVFLTLSTLSSAQNEFVSLFNGTDLDGWEGSTALWSVDDGVIVGSTHGNKISHNQFLRTKKKYRDFILRVQVKLENGNSGVQFRSDALPEYVCAGYQADVAETTFFGMLYEEKKRGFFPYWGELTDQEKTAIHALGKQKEWNQYEIECRGHRVVLRLNGVTTCDIVDSAGATDGVIGLQLHTGPDMRVFFRNIQIQEIPANEKAEFVPVVDDGRRVELASNRQRLLRSQGTEQHPQRRKSIQ